MRMYLRAAAILAILYAFGCGKSVNCDDLESRLNRCRKEVYQELADDSALFLEEIIAPESGISDSSRETIKTAWKEKKTKLSAELADEIIRKCSKHQGRFHFSSKINNCLKKEDCSGFATCFRKAASKKN